jgi:cell shape-determining protein MreC
MRLPSKPIVFVALMVVSLLAVVIPRDPFGALRNLTQILALPQTYFNKARLLTAESTQSTRQAPVDRETYTKLQRQKTASELAVVSLSRRVQELELQLEQVTRIRQQGFPAEGALIAARVLAGDAAVGHRGLLVSGGASAGTASGDWVASSFFVDAGTQEGVADEAAVLAQEFLIGWVSKAMPLTSRVVLMTDRLADNPIRVNIINRRNEFRPVSRQGVALPFVLEGAGGNRMRIPDIPADLVENRRIQVDDLVMSDPSNPWLPVAMMIGKIETLELVRDHEKPLYYDATVLAPYDPSMLSHVFIVDLSRAAGFATPAPSQ